VPEIESNKKFGESFQAKLCPYKMVFLANPIKLNFLESHALICAVI
jgi:hypothetical protein